MQREPNAPVTVPDDPVPVAQEPAAGLRPPSPMRIGLVVLVRRHRSSWPGPMFQHLDEAFGPLRACPSRGFDCVLPLAALHPRVGLVYVDARCSYGPQSNRSLECGPAPVRVDLQPTDQGPSGPLTQDSWMDAYARSPCRNLPSDNALVSVEQNLQRVDAEASSGAHCTRSASPVSRLRR